MATFKELNVSDIQTSKAFLNQLIELVGEDISSSVSRRTYEHFVTGGVASGQPGVTSSLFHTVYDQDYSLQTANPLFDVTIGLSPSGTHATGSEIGTDSNQKRIYPSQSIMMREKGYIYRQYAQLLLGGANKVFTAPLNSTTSTDEISAALFLNIKRLFHRDQLKRGTMTLIIAQSGALEGAGAPDEPNSIGAGSLISPGVGQGTYTDFGGDTNKLSTFGGGVTNIVSGTRTANSQNTVGLNFIDHGILVLDIVKVFSASQRLTGSIDSVAGNIGSLNGKTPFTGTLSQFIVSASIDDALDHFCGTRFGSNTSTRISFQNITNINSSLFFCNLRPNEMNYSSNPTYVNSSNEIQVIETGQEDVQKSFVFITTVGLYDANNNLLAVAKLSRPIEKHIEKNLSIRVRLDY